MFEDPAPIFAFLNSNVAYCIYKAVAVDGSPILGLSAAVTRLRTDCNEQTSCPWLQAFLLV